MAETVVTHTAGRATVFVQVGAMNLRDTLELAAHARSVGADGIAVVTPSYFKLSDDELFCIIRLLRKVCRRIIRFICMEFRSVRSTISLRRLLRVLQRRAPM